MKKYADSCEVDLDEIESIDLERAGFIKGYLKAALVC